MKNLKKFNENWIDDETEDTNRRMSELDAEEGINEPDEDMKYFNEVEDLGKLRNSIYELLDNFRKTHDVSLDNKHFINFLFDE